MASCATARRRGGSVTSSRENRTGCVRIHAAATYARASEAHSHPATTTTGRPGTACQRATQEDQVAHDGQHGGQANVKTDRKSEELNAAVYLLGFDKGA